MLAILLSLGLGCVTAHKAERSVARSDLGEAYLMEGSTELAIEQLEEATRLNPRNVDAWHYLAVAYMKRGAHEEAEKAFKRAIRLDPEDAGIRLNYGYLLQNLGRNEEAIEQLEVARQDLTYRQPAKVLNNLGWAYLQVDRTAEAIAVLEEALFRQPNSCATRYNLAVAYFQADELAKSVDTLEDLMVACREDYPEGMLLLGEVLMDMGRYDEGAMYLQQAIDENPGTPISKAAGERLDQEGMR